MVLRFGHDFLVPFDNGDALVRQATVPDIAACLLPLPLDVVYELGLGPAVRLAAGKPGAQGGRARRDRRRLLAGRQPPGRVRRSPAATRRHMRRRVLVKCAISPSGSASSSLC